MSRGFRLYVWAVIVFASSELLAHKLGIRFASETLGRLYQYLDPAILREDLASGLYYLHAQPPLFNLFLGSVLKLFPEAYHSAFSFLFGAMALGLLLGMAWLMRYLGLPDVVSGVVLLVFALSPNFLVYRNWLFYTLPVALFLVAGGVALALSQRVERLWPLVGFGAATSVLMLTRAMFHPLWMVVIGAALLPVVSKRRRRVLALVALVPFVLANFWLAKNYLLVGSYAASTWLGMSLAKRWPLSQSEMTELKASGTIPRFWHRRPFLEPSDLARFGFFQDEHDVHPALDAPYKSNGEPNFNHRDYARVSAAMLDGDLFLIRHFPGRYLQRVATAFLLFLQPGPNSVHFLVDYDFERVRGYRDWLTRYVFAGGPIERPIRMFEPPANLLVVVFPVLVLAMAMRLRNGPPEQRPVMAYMLVSVVWVTAVANLVEIGENDRMRWEIEPFLAITTGSLIHGIGRALKR